MGRAVSDRQNIFSPDSLKHRADAEERLKTHLGRRRTRVQRQFPKQLGEVLFDELENHPRTAKKTAGGQRSTRESELEKTPRRAPHHCRIFTSEYRESKKLLPPILRIFALAWCRQLSSRRISSVADRHDVTGRMASENLNLQNILLRASAGARYGTFIASSGFALVAPDYSQIELRLAAILRGDEKLCDYSATDATCIKRSRRRWFHSRT